MTTEGILELGALAVVLSSIWMAFVLVIRVAVARWLGASWAYFLWLVPLLGLLAMGIPKQTVQRVLDVPGIEVPVVNSVIETATGLVRLVDVPIVFGSPKIPGHSQSTTPEFVLFTWLLGAWLSLLFFAARSFHFSAKMLRSSRALTGHQKFMVQTRCAGLADGSMAEIRMLSTGRGPAVAGLFQPVLLLPVDFFHRYTTQQQVLILEHEYQHLRRHDLFFLLLARIYRCLFWFNPLVYVAERYLQLDQELSCDERVLFWQSRTTRRIYGETLLLSTHAKFLLPQVSYSPSFGQIKQRTSMLRHHNRRIFGSLIGGLLLMISISASVVYGVLGALELEPELEIREELRLPMAESMTLLEKGDFDDDVLTTMLARLTHLETAFPEQTLSDIELAQMNNLRAFIYFQMGAYEHSLRHYEQVVALAGEVPELKSQALYSIGEIHFAQENYVATLQALVQSEDVSPIDPSAEIWALRSQAHVRLKSWDQGLRYISLAIKQAESDGLVPQEQWLLSQTALKWKLGDLEGAARSLQRSIEIFPKTPYEQTLAALNELVQQSWEPWLTEETLAQF